MNGLVTAEGNQRVKQSRVGMDRYLCVKIRFALNESIRILCVNGCNVVYGADMFVQQDFINQWDNMNLKLKGPLVAG